MTPYGDSAAPDRNLALELVRTTEAAALAAARLVGMGDKEAADQAAVDAMHVVLEGVRMDGIVVIGEGEKDEAPMLANGERVGDGSAPEVDIAVDPLEGTTLTARGMPSALSVIALSERGTMFDPGPCVYMEKLAGSEAIADLLDLDRPLGETLGLVAERKKVDIRDVMVVMLDRDRHAERRRRPRATRARGCASSRRRRERLAARGQREQPGGPAVGHRRHAGGSDLGGRHQVPRRRVRRPAVAAQRRRAHARARRRLRPRPPADPGRPRPQRRLLLLGHRRHRRRLPPGRPLPGLASRRPRSRS